MKANIYNGIENLTKKEVIQARSNEKKQVRSQLADFGASLESAYKQLTAVGANTRNAANAAKGTYKTALQVVTACYPYQTAAGELCTKTRDGFKVRTLKGTAIAYAVVRTAVCNFIDYKTGRRPELVADEVVRELRDCVPPTTLGRIFQVGEARDQDSEHPAWPIFDTFKRVDEGWLYCGACLRGQTEPRKGYIESLYGITG